MTLLYKSLNKETVIKVFLKIFIIENSVELFYLLLHTGTPMNFSYSKIRISYFLFHSYGILKEENDGNHQYVHDPP